MPRFFLLLDFHLISPLLDSSLPLGIKRHQVCKVTLGQPRLSWVRSRALCPIQFDLVTECDDKFHAPCIQRLDARVSSKYRRASLLRLGRLPKSSASRLNRSSGMRCWQRVTPYPPILWARSDSLSGCGDVIAWDLPSNSSSLSCAYSTSEMACHGATPSTQLAANPCLKQARHL